jgi:hypothetical protein
MTPTTETILKCPVKRSFTRIADPQYVVSKDPESLEHRGRAAFSSPHIEGVNFPTRKDIYRRRKKAAARAHFELPNDKSP